MLSLEKRYKEMKKEEIEKEYMEEGALDFEILEKRIEALTMEYQANILKAVRAFYEK